MLDNRTSVFIERLPEYNETYQEKLTELLRELQLPNRYRRYMIGYILIIQANIKPLERFKYLPEYIDENYIIQSQSIIYHQAGSEDNRLIITFDEVDFRMKDRENLVLDMYYKDNMKYYEIAKEIGISPEMVWNYINKSINFFS